MKKNLFLVFCVSILCLSTSVISFAQNDSTISSAAGDLYVISAKAGGVNYLEGSVSNQRINGESGYLVKGDQIEIGDKISTSPNSRLEVLLNPGSFIRLDQNSEFEFINTSLDELALKVTRGSAIFEVYASNDFKVTVTTSKSTFYLVNTGVYRLDALSNGAGKLEVHRGKAQVGNLAADRLGRGRSASVINSEIAISEFDTDKQDEFETWSKDRAKLIAKANNKLKTKTLRNSLLSNSRYDCFGSYGLWVFNQRYSSYSFLPYGSGWRSPYGYGFGTSTGICDNSYYDRYYYPDYRYPTRTNTGGGGGTTTRTVPAENVRRANKLRTPPFRRIQNSGNANTSTKTTSRRGIPTSTFPSARTSSTSTGSSRTTTTSSTSSTKSTTATPRTPTTKSSSRVKN